MLRKVFLGRRRLLATTAAAIGAAAVGAPAVGRAQQVQLDQGAFLVDGRQVKSVEQAPGYPMQMMIAVFDFPEHARASQAADHVPELAIDWVRGS